MSHILVALGLFLIFSPIFSVVGAQTYDFGDRPPRATTAPGAGGARHLPVGPMLGTQLDVEVTYIPTVGANGDDFEAFDDEYGIIFLGPFLPGQVTQVQVVVTGTQSARLSGYFDWDRNTHWNHHTYELTIQDVLLAPVTHVTNVAVPATAVPGPAYARFKLYLGNFPGTPASGEQLSGGVEEYAIMIGHAVVNETTVWSTIKALFR